MSSSIELATLPSEPTLSIFRDGTDEPADSSLTQAALPPLDGGRQAWSFLVGATLIEILVFGVPFSIGVLHEYWSKSLFTEAGEQSTLAVAATLQISAFDRLAVIDSLMIALYVSSDGITVLLWTNMWPFRLLARYPYHRLRFQRIALVISSVSILAAAFATKPWHLVVTLGVLYPFAGMLYLPAATMLFDWFQAKRGLAAGIMYAGTGIGGTLFPFLIQALLTRFHYRTTMLACGVGFFALGAAALTFIKPRAPTPLKGSIEAKRGRKIDKAFLSRSTFWAFSGAILLTSLGNFIPSVWIPTYASDLNMSSQTGTLLVAIMNAASVPGLLLLGYLSDHYPLRAVMTLSCMGSALSCLFLWGFAKNLSVLVIFVVVFGALGLSFSALWTKLISVIARDDPLLPTVLFSIFAGARGIGNISSGPVADALLKTSLPHAKGAYGVKNYGALLLYTGLTMLLGSLAGVLYRDPRRGAATAATVRED